MARPLNEALMSGRKLHAHYTRRVIDEAAARPLPELTRGQKVGSRLLVIGTFVLERATREHLKEGATQSVRDIEALMHPSTDREPNGITGLHTNKFDLHQLSANAGLPSTQVQLSKNRSTGEPSLWLWSPPKSELPDSMTRPLVHEPIFKLRDGKLNVMLHAERDVIPKPFDQLDLNQQMLAYLIISDVAETMQQAQQGGNLTVE